MTELDYMREYYSTRFWVDGMPPVESLSEDDLKYLCDTATFASWRINKYFKEIGREIVKSIEKIFS